MSQLCLHVFLLFGNSGLPVALRNNAWTTAGAEGMPPELVSHLPITFQCSGQGACIFPGITKQLLVPFTGYSNRAEGYIYPSVSQGKNNINMVGGKKSSLTPKN